VIADGAPHGGDGLHDPFDFLWIRRGVIHVLFVWILRSIDPELNRVEAFVSGFQT